MKEGNYSTSADAETWKQANNERVETKLTVYFWMLKPVRVWKRLTIKEGITLVILKDVFGEALVGKNAGRVQSCKEQKGNLADQATFLAPTSVWCQAWPGWILNPWDRYLQHSGSCNAAVTAGEQRTAVVTKHTRSKTFLKSEDKQNPNWLGEFMRVFRSSSPQSIKAFVFPFVEGKLVK